MIREDWVESRLGDICDVVMGQSPPSSTYNTEGRGLPFFQGKAEFTDLYPVVRKWCDAPKRTAQPCDILLSVRAPVGSVNIANVECAIGRGLAAISYPPNYKYIWYYLQLIEGELDAQGTGTTFKSISGRTLRSQRVPLAPLAEQRAIVFKIEQLFSELENAIANLKVAKEKLGIYRQVVLKRAFEGGLTNSVDIRWVRLADVCDGFQYGTSTKSENKGIVPVVRMGNIQNGQIDWSDLKFTSDPVEIEKYRLKKNDVLFNRTNSPEHVGKTAIYRGNREAIFAGYLIRVHYNKDIVNGDYLNYFLNSPKARQHGDKVKSFGVNQSNINATKLKSYPFPKCTLQGQIAIVRDIDARLSICDRMLADIEKALERSGVLRQSILRMAFEGKLLTKQELEACHQEPDWEPADKLLERIKKQGNE